MSSVSGGRDAPVSHRDSEEERIRRREGIARHSHRVHGVVGIGKPVIALGSDIDGIPQSSQKPGVAYHAPLIEGAPGHGEGQQRSGRQSDGDLAVKKIMEREKLPGTIRVWPGRRRSWSARRPITFAGLLQGCRRRAVHARRQRTHGVVGDRSGTGLVSVEYTFRGQTAHRRGRVARPQRTRCRRADEHRLELPARASAARAPSHYVVTNGGDQPNVARDERLGTTSARRRIRRSRSSGRSATTWPKGPR